MHQFPKSTRHLLVHSIGIGRALCQLGIHLGAHRCLRNDVQGGQADEGIDIEARLAIGSLLQTLDADARLLVKDLDELLQYRKVKGGRDYLAPLMPHSAMAEQESIAQPLAQQLVQLMLDQVLLAGEQLLIELRIAAGDEQAIKDPDALQISMFLHLLARLPYKTCGKPKRLN